MAIQATGSAPRSAPAATSAARCGSVSERPLAAAPADVVAWLGERAPDHAAAATCCDRIRGLFASGGRDAEDDEPPVSVALAARAYLAWREI